MAYPDCSTQGKTVAAVKKERPILAICGMEEEDRSGATSTIAMMRKNTRRNSRMLVTIASIIALL